MLINEIYPAVQGEGSMSGTPCVFVRTHACPVGCSWCDTAFTWDGSEKGKRMHNNEIISEVIKHGLNHVVISGGEPTIQPDLHTVLTGLYMADMDSFEIETAGIKPFDYNHVTNHATIYNVSPKLPSAQPKVKPDVEVLETYLDRKCNSIFKFVIADDEDYAAMKKLVADLNLEPERVWLMPEGQTQAAITKSLASLMQRAVNERFRYRISNRMQVTAFGKKRGV